MMTTRSVRAVAAAAMIAAATVACSGAPQHVAAGEDASASAISGTIESWQDAVCHHSTPDGADSCTPHDGDGTVNFDHFGSPAARDSVLSWSTSHHAAHTVVDDRPLVIWTPEEESDLHPLQDFGFTVTSNNQPSTFIARPADIVREAVPSTEGAVPLPVNEYGYAVVQTASGDIQCMIQAAFVGCQSDGMSWPAHLDGSGPYHGVKVNPDGSLNWIDGNLGADLPTTLGNQAYQALGWTIVADESGIRFGNDGTGHGAIVRAARVQQF